MPEMEDEAPKHHSKAEGVSARKLMRNISRTQINTLRTSLQPLHCTCIHACTGDATPPRSQRTHGPYESRSSRVYKCGSLRGTLKRYFTVFLLIEHVSRAEPPLTTDYSAYAIRVAPPVNHYTEPLLFWFSRAFWCLAFLLFH